MTKSGKCFSCGKRTTRKAGDWLCLPCAKESWADGKAEDRSINAAYERHERTMSDHYEAIHGDN